MLNIEYTFFLYVFICVQHILIGTCTDYTLVAMYIIERRERECLVIVPFKYIDLFKNYSK